MDFIKSQPIWDKEYGELWISTLPVLMASMTEAVSFSESIRE